MPHFNIPVFIPELACPFRCIYCNQYRISGNCRVPSPAEIHQVIQRHLETLPRQGAFVELAFFGGSFTGLPIHQQRAYLSLALPYLEQEKLQGIRLSTRPDYINAEVIRLLKEYRVTAVELGAQSLDDEVLKASGRGHTASVVLDAAQMLLDAGFETGLQMMTGLPADTEEKSIETARKIIASGAQTTRIYPTLVIRDTPLAILFEQGKFAPQSEEQAIDLCARLYDMFQQAGVKVLRMGLHPSEGLFDGTALLAGPFHPALGEKILSRVWRQKIASLLVGKSGSHIKIGVHPKRLNVAIGHKAINKLWLLQQFSTAKFTTDPKLQPHEITIDLD